MSKSNKAASAKSAPPSLPDKIIKTFKGFTARDYITGGILSLILFLVPVVVRLKELQIPLSEQPYDPSLTKYYDLFSYNKAMILTYLSIALFVFLVFTVSGSILKADYKAMLKNPVIIASTVYIVTAVLSTAFSKYKDIAVNGGGERYEGIYVLLGYFVIWGAIIYYSKSKLHINILLTAIMASACVVGLVGLAQFLGINPYLTDLGAKLVTGDKALKLYSKYDAVYSTLYNPNCVGIYTAMLIPLTFNLGVFSKGRVVRVFLFGLCAVMLACLVGSRSTGGFIGISSGIFISFVTAVVYFLKNKRSASLRPLLLSAGVLVVLAVVAFMVPTVRSYAGEALSKFSSLNPKESPNFFKDVAVDQNKVIITSSYGVVSLVFDAESGEIRVLDKNDKIVSMSPFDEKSQYKGAGYVIDGFGTCMIYDMGEGRIVFQHRNNNFMFMITEQGNMVAYSITGEPLDLNQEIPSIGFKGSELFATSRGYIWSRALPLLKSRVLIGSGPDTFMVEFPQQDFLGKIRYLGDAYIKVDKAHNLYLQTAVTTGIISTLALIFIFGWFLVKSFSAIVNGKYSGYFFGLQFGIFIGVFSYLVTSLTTDSVVSVAPVFWALLGIGFALILKGNNYAEQN